MKKRTLLLGLLLGLTVSVWGCGNEPEAPVEEFTEVIEENNEPVEAVEETVEETVEEPEEVVVDEGEKPADNSSETLYKTILDDYYNMVVNNAYEEYAEEWDTGVVEICMYGSPEETLDSLGYCFMDLNNDSVDELLIGAVTNADEQIYPDTMLVIYSMVNGEPKAVLSGWARSSQYLMKDNTITNCASGGAASYVYANRYLDENNEIQTNDFYFTDYEANGGDELSVYYNQTSVWDKAEAEKIDMSSDELYKLSDTEVQSNAVYDIPYVSFREYGAGSSNVSSGVASDASLNSANDALKIMPADGNVDQYDDYKEFAIGNGGSTKVLLIPTEEITNVKAYELTFEDATDDGDLIFTGKEVCGAKKVTKDCPLVITLQFVGDIPNNGISFEDKNGNVKTYAIAESGRDGSVLLQEITIK